MKISKLTYRLILISGVFLTACSGNNRVGGDYNKNEHTDHQTAEVYACPMHPEITGKKGDKCSKCGMQLEVKKETHSASNFRMELKNPGDVIDAGKSVKLTFVPTNKLDKSAKVELDTQHEKKFHLIVVSEDLSWFRHLHPEAQADGSYTLTTSFPNGGKYLLFADYKPKDGSAIVDKIDFSVKGAESKTVNYSSAQLVSDTDGYRVSFVNGDELQSGKEGHIGITIEKSGTVLKGSDLQPYLGAAAHIIMISQAEKEFIHVHPSSDADFPIHGQASIPKPGIYRMWVQFQTEGKVHTAPFTVNVTQGKGESMSGHSSHAH